MTVRNIYQFPHPILKTTSISVTKFGEETRDLFQDLTDTLYASPGVGLAAPQIGVSLRVAAVDVTRRPPSGRPPAPGHGLLLLVNPRIVAAEGEQRFREGCLSVPDFLADIRRSARVKVEAMDAQGKPVVVEANGFEAVALQHELDHLDGILFLDRVADVKTDLFRRKKPPAPPTEKA